MLAFIFGLIVGTASTTAFFAILITQVYYRARKARPWGG